MVTFLYIIWFCLPLFFFTIALWSKLEAMSGKDKRENFGDFFKQGVFVTGCVLLAVAIDQYVLADLVAAVSPDFIPLGLYQFLLLPFILYIGALAVGPSKSISLKKEKPRTYTNKNNRF
jgi:hypothetical protein